MISNFFEKMRESLVSVAPVMLIVALLHFTIAPLPEGQLAQFIIGGALLIAGLGIFLVGADIGMIPFGQKIGSALTRKRTLMLILPAAFGIGFAVTIAEPDVQVLATQVNLVNPAIAKTPLLLMIAIGVGLFLVVGVARTVLKLPLRTLLFVFYGLVFFACLFVDSGFVGVAFDAGGATTGPITVPFIMALGIGVASTAKKSEGDDSSFGMVGLASIGPIAAVAVMGMLSPPMAGSAESFTPVIPEAGPLLAPFLKVLPHVIYEIGMALLPLLFFVVLFQITLLHLPATQVKRIVLGMCYAFVGLVMFLTGVNGGFSPAGQSLGMALGGLGGWALIPIGFFLGAVVVCAEPAVWILTEQVEEVSGGYIRRPIMLGALSFSVACAVVLGMLRVVTGLSIWWVLAPGYILALGMTLFCPRLFTSIAFDSGGVASGPMSATFVLSLTLGASCAVGGNPTTDAFGMIAMIAMAPLITIQALGIAVRIAESRKKKREKGRSLCHEQ